MKKKATNKKLFLGDLDGQELDAWHPVNGKWVFIQRVIRDNAFEYYTNGVLEKRTPIAPPYKKEDKA